VGGERCDVLPVGVRIVVRRALCRMANLGFLSRTAASIGGSIFALL